MQKWLGVLGWVAFCLALAFIASFWPAHADGFDYRDKRGVRHWNHYAHARHIRHTRTVRHKKHALHIRIVKDRVKFVPLPPEVEHELEAVPQAEPSFHWPLSSELPWAGELRNPFVK